MTPRSSAVTALRGVIALLLVTSTAGAQGKWPPDTLRNLKVLPASMTPREVVGIMRSYAGSLGVRCHYCHVGEEGKPLETFDFASDEKRTKQTARIMMRMVRDINENALSQIPDSPLPAVNVTCATCHRGVPRPATIGQVVLEAIDAKGVDSARTVYKSLRERYANRASYDFGEPALVSTALELSRGGRHDDALTVLRFNDELFPTSPNTMNNIGDVLMAKRDTAGAVDAYRTALKRDSTDFVAKDRLRNLGKLP